MTLNVTRAPTCQDVARKTKVGTAVSIPLTCTDPDGDTLTLSKVTDPAHGTLGAISAGAVTYTPAAGYFGPDSFTYKASDGTANSTPATVSITVTRARELLGRVAADEGRHGGVGAADLHRRRRRRADAVDRQRPGARHARRDLGAAP